MKKLILIALAIVCGVAISEGFAKKPNKQKLTKEEIEVKLDSLRNEQAKQQTLKDEIDEFNSYDKGRGPARHIDLKEIHPCMEESYVTMEEVRAFGFGEGTTDIQARKNAIQSAVEDLSIKAYPESIRYVTTSYPSGETESLIEINITDEQKQYVRNNYQMLCYKILQNEDGAYQAYVAISISLTKIKQYKQ